MYWLGEVPLGIKNVYNELWLALTGSYSFQVE